MTWRTTSRCCPTRRRYKAAHVAKVLRCNWKVAQEAFSEAYHTVATHPQILEGLADANTKYDVFGNYSRAMSPQAVPSPHVAGLEPPDIDDLGLFTKLRHPSQPARLRTRRGRRGQGHLTADGKVGTFTDAGVRIDGEFGEADPNLCNWIGGKQLPASKTCRCPCGSNLVRRRRPHARRPAMPAARHCDRCSAMPVDQISDAEICDAIYLTVFPNWHPWGSFNRIMYRFRPYGNDPDMCIHECMYFFTRSRRPGTPSGCADPLARRR